MNEVIQRHTHTAFLWEENRNIIFCTFHGYIKVKRLTNSIRDSKNLNRFHDFNVDISMSVCTWVLVNSSWRQTEHAVRNVNTIISNRLNSIWNSEEEKRNNVEFLHCCPKEESIRIFSFPNNTIQMHIFQQSYVFISFDEKENIDASIKNCVNLFNERLLRICIFHFHKLFLLCVRVTLCL